MNTPTFRPLLRHDAKFEPLFPTIVEQINKNKLIYGEAYRRQQEEEEKKRALKSHNAEVAKLYKRHDQ